MLVSRTQHAAFKARELQYWDQWMRIKGAEYWVRMTNHELEDDIKALIPSAFLRERSQTIRVLDAGAGPVTQLGSVWPGRDLELHACDLLAAEYDELLGKYDLDPPVRTVFANVEALGRAYPRHHFHVVLARDVIEQTRDPRRALSGMLAVLKPHGTLLIVHDKSKDSRHAHMNALWHVREVDGHPLLVQETAHVMVNLTASGEHYGAVVTLMQKGSNMFIRVVKENLDPSAARRR